MLWVKGKPTSGASWVQGGKVLLWSQCASHLGRTSYHKCRTGSPLSQLLQLLHISKQRSNLQRIPPNTIFKTSEGKPAFPNTISLSPRSSANFVPPHSSKRKFHSESLKPLQRANVALLEDKGVSFSHECLLTTGQLFPRAYINYTKMLLA